jgi:uncharacterized membrane protein YeaQ/YmgE (transglycosylase-associated protein family)/uncharacterized protein YjbJ (UPF0337 family)
MNSITWLFAGAVLGLLASIVVRRRHSAYLLNILVGTVGAFLGGFLLYPMFHISVINSGAFNLPALLVSLGGAVFLLVVVNLFRRENNVNNQTIERRWAQVSAQIHTRWGKLTEEDVAKIDGNHNRFIDTLQARYGCTKNEAEDQIQRYLKAVLVDSRHSSSVYDWAQVVDHLPGSHQ